MYAVIFEVRVKPGRQQDYLEIAGRLRAELSRIDGFISIERFASLAEEGKMLSVSFWRDEEAVAAWRGDAEHRKAQAKGRAEIFDDYRIRVARVVRDYGMHERGEAPDSEPAEA